MNDEESTREEHFRESCMSDEEPNREEHIREIREEYIRKTREEPTREEHFCESCMSDEEPTSEEHFCKFCMMDFCSETQNESHVEEINTENLIKRRAETRTRTRPATS